MITIRPRGHRLTLFIIAITGFVLVLKFNPFNVGTRVKVSQRRDTEETRSTYVGDGLEQGQGRTLCAQIFGRIGNEMFEYAAVLGIARKNGMIPAVIKQNPLNKVFQLGARPIEEKLCLSFRPHHDKKPSTYDEYATTVDSRFNTSLAGAFQSWRYFRDVETELRQHFEFKDEVMDQARLVLTNCFYHKGIKLSPKMTLVGIHVRRGDLLEQSSTGYTVASRDYFARAMNFFQGRYPSVIFVLCSENIDWPLQNIPRDSTIFIPPQSPEVDLAILSLCDHMIMSVGTYGWWAGWLAGGITVYYKEQYAKGSPLEQNFNMSDYIYPGWIGFA